MLFYTQQLRLLASWSPTLICCVTVRHTPHLVWLRRFCVSQRGVVPIRLCLSGGINLFATLSFCPVAIFNQVIKLLPPSRDSSILSNMALPVVRPWTAENQLQFESLLEEFPRWLCLGILILCSVMIECFYFSELFHPSSYWRPFLYFTVSSICINTAWRALGCRLSSLASLGHGLSSFLMTSSTGMVTNVVELNFLIKLTVLGASLTWRSGVTPNAQLIQWRHPSALNKFCKYPDSVGFCSIPWSTWNLYQ